jgi:hypothetical protein
MKQHPIIINGPDSAGVRLPGGALLVLIQSLIAGGEQALRFLAEGQSTKSGTRPGWLTRAAGIDIVGLSRNSPQTLYVEAFTLDEVRQGPIADMLDPGLFESAAPPALGSATTIELFVDILEAALSGNDDLVLADKPLLETCANLATFANSGLESLDFGRIGARTKPLLLRGQDRERLLRLSQETPDPEPVRTLAILDTISASSSHVVLRLQNGDIVQAWTGRHDPERLRRLWGHSVVAEGLGLFRRSGKLWAIHAESIEEESGPGDAVFAVPPRSRRQIAPAPPLPQATLGGPPWGDWPGEETEEELLDALRELNG